MSTNLMFLNNPLLLFLSPALTRVLYSLIDRLLDDLLRLVRRPDRHGVLLLLAAVGEGPDRNPDVPALQFPFHARRQVRTVFDFRRKFVERLRFALVNISFLKFFSYLETKIKTIKQF